MNTHIWDFVLEYDNQSFIHILSDLIFGYSYQVHEPNNEESSVFICTLTTPLDFASSITMTNAYERDSRDKCAKEAVARITQWNEANNQLKYTPINCKCCSQCNLLDA